ncbi:DUF7351 domain-containing protein [Natronobacterium lacisalsi]
MRGEYVGGRFRIDCHECDDRVLNVGVPPSAARERSPSEFADACELWPTTQRRERRSAARRLARRLRSPE